MRLRAYACIALAACAASVAIGCGEDPVPKLEAERAALLDKTRPKAEFWSEVERKGGFAKEKASVEKEITATEAQTTALKAEQDALAAALEQSRSVNAQAGSLLASRRAERDRLEREVNERAATLERYAARREVPPS
jgi:hypothetical protein